MINNLFAIKSIKTSIVKQIPHINNITIIKIKNSFIQLHLLISTTYEGYELYTKIIFLLEETFTIDKIKNKIKSTELQINSIITKPQQSNIHILTEQYKNKYFLQVKRPILRHESKFSDIIINKQNKYGMSPLEILNELSTIKPNDWDKILNGSHNV